MGELIDLKAYRTRKRIDARYGANVFGRGKEPVVIEAKARRLTRKEIDVAFRRIARRERRGDRQLRLV